jgi:UDP:flavonoid glycosyltransferase YjiC (YdhE family)
LNAQRVAELGAGLTIDADASPAAIAEAITCGRDDHDYRRNATALATASRDAGEAAAAAEADLKLAQ